MGVGEVFVTITVNDTAKASKAIYKNNDFEGFTLMGGFFDPKNTNRFGWDKEGDAGGASAGIYKYNSKSGMYILSFRGSSNSPFTKGDGRKDWTVDDATLAAGFTPERASDCVKYANSVSAQYPDSFILVTGHSLGGYLAQVVGVLCDMPFITWNAPPALSTWTGNLADGTKASRFRKGLNFRINWDPVSKLTAGKHVGPVKTLPHVGVNILNAHTNSAIEKSIAQSPLKNLPAMGCITMANRN
jgi:putative lipase involved disintegration of autophagic bodies